MRNVLLIVSVAINIFLIGMMAGGLFSGGTPPWGDKPEVREARDMQGPPRAGRQGARSEWLLPMRHIRLLPEEHRRAARRLIADRLPEARELRREARLAEQAIADVLAQEELDIAALEAAVAELSARRTAQQDYVAETFVLFFTDLPTEQRQFLIEQMNMDREENRRRIRQRLEERRRDGLPPEGSR